MPDTFTAVLTLAVYVLTVARLTRIVTTDKIGEPLRVAVAERFGSESMVSYLAYCPACMSIWIAFGLAPAAAALAGMSWWLLPFIALSASHVTILLSRLDTP